MYPKSAFNISVKHFTFLLKYLCSFVLDILELIYGFDLCYTDVFYYLHSLNEKKPTAFKLLTFQEYFSRFFWETVNDSFLPLSLYHPDFIGFIHVHIFSKQYQPCFVVFFPSRWFLDWMIRTACTKCMNDNNMHELYRQQ